MRFAIAALLLAVAAPAQEPWDSFPPNGHQVERTGSPGFVAVYGEEAHAILTSGDKRPQAVAAVTAVGKGRAFAIAHNGYLSAKFWEEESGLMQHALRWLRNDQKPGVAACVTANPGLESLLREQGYTVVPYALANLQDIDFLLLEGEGPRAEEELQAWHAWLNDGGQVLAAICPWGWQQINGRRGWELPRDMAANQLLMPHGLLFVDGYAAAKQDGRFMVDVGTCRAMSCWPLLEKLGKRGNNKPSFTAQELWQLEKTLRGLPAEEQSFVAPLVASLPELDEASAPTPDSPLRAKEDAWTRLAVVALDQQLQKATADNPQVAPGAHAFPGSVPEKAQRVSQVIPFSAAQPGWQSTGLYLAPGEILRVQVLAGETKGWQYRIGAHADKLWHKDRWPRWPSVSRSGEVSANITSPFGGLVYLEAKGKQAQDLELQLDGAVLAPWWQQGKTSDEEWRLLREHPAPWAELQGKYLILTLPSASIRELDNPQQLMDWWDGVVEEQFVFAGEEPPNRPERFVSDVLISAGYMHSGYPIMMHLDVAETRKNRPAVLVDIEELQSKGNWGCFHELGHNRQKPTWTFGGTGEVTNNLFSLYSGEQRSGITPWENPWLQNQKKAGAAYLRDGADFAQWKRMPGVALLCYAQVQKDFGWEPISQVFRVARDLAPAQRPKNDAAKQAFWIRELSLACQRDLRPFHAMWGWPIAESLQQDSSLDELEEWMPDFAELKS